MRIDMRRTTVAVIAMLAGLAFAAASPQTLSIGAASDLQAVLPQVGFDYATVDGSGNYQDTCPRCRRAQVTLAQSARVGGFG